MKKTLFSFIVIVIVFAQFSCTTDRTREGIYKDHFRFEEYTIAQLQQGYANGEFTVTEVVQAYLDRIKTIDDSGPMLNAVIQVNPDHMVIAAKLVVGLKEGRLCRVSI